VIVGSGTLQIRAPRVNDKRVDPETRERKRFSLRILPAYARRSPKETDVFPILYLRGLSTGRLRPGVARSARRGRRGAVCELGIRNGRLEALNSRVQLIRYRAHRFHSPDAPDRAGLPRGRAHPARLEARRAQANLPCIDGSAGQKAARLR
jgi:hypothetical protein